MRVVVAADVLAADEDVGHGALTSELEQLGLDCRAVRRVVELERLERRAQLGEERLRSSAERAVRLAEEDHVVCGDERVDAPPDGIGRVRLGIAMLGQHRC